MATLASSAAALIRSLFLISNGSSVAGDSHEISGTEEKFHAGGKSVANCVGKISFSGK
jgi:hypothetical protein